MQMRSRAGSLLVLTSLAVAGASTRSESEPRKKGPTSTTPLPRDAVISFVDRMQAFYQKTNDFTADFKQDYVYKTFNRAQSSSGKVMFKKPAMMRWDYQSPPRRTFVLSGGKAYAFDPDSKTLTITGFDASELSTSVTFLWGRGKLLDEFSIKLEECKACTGKLLALTPIKPESRYKQIRLEVDPKSAQVLRSTVIDPDDSENTMAFSNLKLNPGLTDKEFAINPPEGTEIVDLTKKGR